MKAKGEIATINDALDNMPKMIEYKPTNFITTKSGVSIPKSMEQDVETIKTAEKLGREANLRSQGRTAYNPKGEFQDTKVEPKKPVEVEILNENKNVPSTELAKPKAEDIIDAKVIQNKPKGLTEEQSVRYESIMKDEVEPIRKEIERVGRAMNQVGKQNTTASKKKEMLKDYEVQLRKLNADLVTANKKLPKK